MDWPATTDTYITGFRANPGNAPIVHHVIAFLAQPSDVATYQQLDDADPAPGYVCFGGPGGPNGGAERALARRVGARLARRRFPRRHRHQGARRQQGRCCRCTTT